MSTKVDFSIIQAKQLYLKLYLLTLNKKIYLA